MAQNNANPAGKSAYRKTPHRTFFEIPLHMMLICAWIFLLALVCGSETGITTASHGQYYLRETPVGLGVFAAKTLEPFEVLHTTIAISVPISLIIRNQLINYSKGYNMTHGLLILGVGSLFNHAQNPNKVNIREFITTADDSTILVTYECNSVIFPHEEILISYGDEDWFSDRDIVWEEIESSSPSTTSAGANLSKRLFGSAEQFLSLRDRKLFAKSSVVAGAVVELARVWRIPVTARLWQYAEPQFNALLWFDSLEPVLAAEDAALSPYRVAPFNASHSYAAIFSGLASFFLPSKITSLATNQTSSVDANVRAEWMVSSGDHTIGMVRFVASRAIGPGEALVLEGYELVAVGHRRRKVLSTLAQKSSPLKSVEL